MKVSGKPGGKFRGPAKKGKFGKVKKGPQTRKDVRKEKRTAKKLKKQQHTLVKSSQGKQVQAPVPLPSKKGTDPKKSKKTKRGGAKNKVKPSKDSDDDEEEDGPVDIAAEKMKLDREMKKHRLEQLKMANEEEDKNIKKLEKLMKMNRRKSKKLPKSFVDEGLDYLLEVCDSERMASLRQDPSLLESSDSEFEDDLAQVTGKVRSKPKSNDSDQSDEDLDEDMLGDEEDGSGDEDLIEEDDEDLDDEDEEMGSMEEDFSEDELVEKPAKTAVKDSSKKRVKFQDEVDSEAQSSKKKKVEVDDDDLSDQEDEVLDSKDLSGEEETGDTWEDIYGRTRDKKGNVVQATGSKYIPPALRGGGGTDSAKLARLKRQMQGLLNRVAEGNMASVATQLEQVITATSRGDANLVLGQLLHALAPAGSITPARMVAEHSLLLALLHAHIGVDIGAAFLQSTVEKYDAAYIDCKVVEDKTLNNLLQILCFMYCFKIFHCTLIFDILEQLASGFEEKDVELILLILKTVGPSLRKDDPAALKNVIIQLQKQASSSSAENSRVAFMLDVLLAIKNNNMSKIPDYDSDLVDRLRKLLRALLRAGASVSELKISLKDLLNAQQRGKWWVVGSAWQGAGPGEASAANASAAATSKFSQKLLDLARKQRMNTELRRNVFCILMTAEDFIDAFEKLLHLGLKGQQEREIPYVILDCCLQEGNFNPYYAHLAQKFCDYDRKFKMSIQCSIWDKVKELESLSKGQIRNLASFTSFLILEGGLTLAVLKVIEFSDLSKTKVKFIRQVLLQLLLAKKEEECIGAFTRLPSSGQLGLFREGTRLFLHRYILGQGATAEEQLLKSRVCIAERLLTNPDNKVRF